MQILLLLILQALCSLDLRGDIHLNDVEKESLAQNGWLIYAGQEVLEFDSLSENDLQKSDDQLYKASKSAVSFVNLMRSKTDKGPIRTSISFRPVRGLL